mmetsp:Transcript_25562/g.70259  ORF Transcript_25562/g.70259 Transcript_25562/m.70259 type:complete len:204 (-) Transcript_25562:2-613(-)
MVVLEGVVQSDHPAVLGDAQHVLLSPHVLHLVLLDHLLLAHLLHREDLAGVLLPAEPDDAEGADADHLDQLEVRDGDLLAALAQVLILLHAPAPPNSLLLVLRERGLLEMLAQLLRHGAPLLEVLRLFRPLVLDRLLEGLQPRVLRARRSAGRRAAALLRWPRLRGHCLLWARLPRRGHAIRHASRPVAGGQRGHGPSPQQMP